MKGAAMSSPGLNDASNIARNGDGAVFREPWEAQAFALVLSLHERGLFSWNEWTAALGDAIKKAQAADDPDTGATYYHHWLNALEHIVSAKGLADEATLAHPQCLGERLRAHPARRADRTASRRLCRRSMIFFGKLAAGFPDRVSRPHRWVAAERHGRPHPAGWRG
jgi:nitrile hydratase accessory protein